MAEHMIAPLATVANTLGNLLIEEGKFLHGVEDQVEELRRELQRIQWFLRDAGARKIDEDRIQQWVLEAKDIAYDAEDLLEGYAFKLGDGIGGCFQALEKYACVCKNSYDRHQLGSSIQALRSRILSLTRSFEVYGVRAVMVREGSSSVQHQLRRTYSFVEEEDFVGLEMDVDLLVKHLVVGDDYRVVSISGMGGLGKTTLANKVYKHRDVKRFFDGFAWICVSQQWQTKDILQRILVKLDPGKREEIEKQWREDELISHLFRVQQQTKCLIVLDDIWETEAWDCIKAAFPRGQTGSKILLTTRNEEVALHIGPGVFHHQPRPLSDDECWELLQKKALHQRDNGNGHHMNDFAILGKEMVEHCAGLPLAVIILGGILSTKSSLSEWETVHENIKSFLWKGKGFGKGKGEIEKILGMSYYDLPFKLKPCFLYLGCFPEDAEISAVTIYQMWMAEGLVLHDSKNTESIMELAELYLGELGQRGMVQLQTFDRPGMKRRFKSCRLHDLMRELCLREAERENFMSCVHYSSKGKGTNPSWISKLRRLVITFDDEDDTSTYIFRDKEIMKYLRMVRYEIPLGHFKKKVIEPHLSIFDDFEMLRVLSIEAPWYSNLPLWLKLPEAVGGLIHMKYLSTKAVGGYYPRVKLPSSLANLKHLQTLDLTRSELPPNAQNIFLKMTGLVCLYLPLYAREGKIHYKVRLRGLDKLEVLEHFSDEMYETKDLIKLANLRVLKVSRCDGLGNLEMIAKYAQGNNQLEDVEIQTNCDFSVNKERGLMVLKQFLFGSIRCLITTGPKWKFPEYEPNTSSNLLDLYIAWRGLNLVEDIKTLEQYTCLRLLHICDVKGKKVVFPCNLLPSTSKIRTSPLSGNGNIGGGGRSHAQSSHI